MPQLRLQRLDAFPTGIRPRGVRVAEGMPTDARKLQAITSGMKHAVQHIRGRKRSPALRSENEIARLHIGRTQSRQGVEYHRVHKDLAPRSLGLGSGRVPQV